MQGVKHSGRNHVLHVDLICPDYTRTDEDRGNVARNTALSQHDTEVDLQKWDGS